MTRFYSIGRFLVPWLAFSALSGLFTGFVFGLFVTLGGFLGGAVALLNGTDDLFKTFSQLAQKFPEFAFLVVCLTLLGIVCGFLTGSIAALFGDFAGFCWSFVSAIGISIIVLPQFYNGIEFIPAFVLSAFGTLLPIRLLSSSPFRYELGEPVQQWLRSTWLVKPPYQARVAGILLPIALCVSWEMALVFPEFRQHQNYVARLGNWEIWQNSKRLVVSRNAHRYSPRSSCQSNLKQIMLGIKQYQQDYDEIYPPNLTDPANGIMAVVQPYLKSTQIFQCPTEFYAYNEGKFESGDFSDYWFNARLYGLPESSVLYAPNTIAWGDGNTGGGEANSTYSLRNLPVPFEPAGRHLFGANYAFSDGHAKWLVPSAIYNTAPSNSTFTMQP